MPFGAGDRSCIGQKLALQEGVLALAMFVQAFRIEGIDLDKVFSILIK